MAASPLPRGIDVVRGSVEDLPAVMEIMCSAFDPRYGEGWSLSQCAGIMPLRGVDLILARDDDGRIRGFSLARTIEDESELLLIAVEKGSQSQGIGQMLLDLFVDQGRRNACRLLHLEVRDGNRAIEMYRRSGFEPVGIRRKYYRGDEGKRYDAVTMGLNLD